MIYKVLSLSSNDYILNLSRRQKWTLAVFLSNEDDHKTDLTIFTINQCLWLTPWCCQDTIQKLTYIMLRRSLGPRQLSPNLEWPIKKPSKKPLTFKIRLSLNSGDKMRLPSYQMRLAIRELPMFTLFNNRVNLKKRLFGNIDKTNRDQKRDVRLLNIISQNPLQEP